MNTEERKNRILARGEHSNHCHVVTGDVEITRNNKGEITFEVGDEGAVLKHILETNWMNGEEVWTKEHHDILLEKGSYKHVHQNEFDPIDKIVRRVID